MNAAILCVGKLKERWQREGCAEYRKRLSFTAPMYAANALLSPSGGVA